MRRPPKSKSKEVGQQPSPLHSYMCAYLVARGYPVFDAEDFVADAVTRLFERAQGEGLDGEDIGRRLLTRSLTYQEKKRVFNSLQDARRRWKRRQGRESKVSGDDERDYFDSIASRERGAEERVVDRDFFLYVGDQIRKRFGEDSAITRVWIDVELYGFDSDDEPWVRLGMSGAQWRRCLEKIRNLVERKMRAG